MRLISGEVLAAAVLDIFPGVQLVGCRVTSIGFSYDFIFPSVLPEESLILIEERMRGIMKQKVPLQTMDMMRKNAMEFFRHHKQFSLVDLLAEDTSSLVQIWKMGDFYDVGSPPENKSSGDSGFFKLLKIEPVKAIVRISGTAFSDKQALKDFLKKQELAKKRDHLLLGKEMGLFSFPTESEQDRWGFLPKGAWLFDALVEWWKNAHVSQKCKLVRSPRSTTTNLEDRGGDFHAESFLSLEPSAKELPLRFYELKEKFEDCNETELCGLFKTRFFTGDRVSIFCSLAQVEGELNYSLQFIDKTVKMFGLEYQYILASDAPVFGLTKKSWGTAKNWLLKALQSNGLEFTEASVASKFGPSIEVLVKDALGRTWVTAALGIDITHPTKMVLRYRGADDMLHEPVMVTRTLFGSLERFVGLLLEQYAGLLPLWLAPEQVTVVPISSKYMRYASEIVKGLEESGFRVGLDYSQGNLGAKVHAAEQQKVPYIVIVGDKEENDKTVTLRSCGQGKSHTGLKLESIIELLRNENSRDK